MPYQALTLEEKQAILEETLRLIREPASWIVGKWKCNVYEADEKGNIIKDENGKAIRACDKLNRPLAQYCIEGAANQATKNVVGETRARRLGATVEGSEMADLLGLNDLAYELSDYDTALDLNDSYVDNQKEGHKVITNLVRTAIDRVKQAR